MPLNQKVVGWYLIRGWDFIFPLFLIIRSTPFKKYLTAYLDATGRGWKRLERPLTAHLSYILRYSYSSLPDPPTASRRLGWLGHREKFPGWGFSSTSVWARGGLVRCRPSWCGRTGDAGGACRCGSRGWKKTKGLLGFFVKLSYQPWVRCPTLGVDT